MIAADAEHALIPRANGEGERTPGAERAVAATVERERLLGAAIEQRLSALASEELQAVELEETAALENAAFPVSALALAAAAPDPFARRTESLHRRPRPLVPRARPSRSSRGIARFSASSKRRRRLARGVPRDDEPRTKPWRLPRSARPTRLVRAESSERKSAQVAVAAHAAEAQTLHSGEVVREKDVSRAVQVELTIANERAATEAQAREVERLIEAERIAIAGLMPEAERLASDERDAQERGAADARLKPARATDPGPERSTTAPYRRLGGLCHTRRGCA